MTDNVAVQDGFTRSIIATSDLLDLYLLVRPGTDFDDRFRAWDTDGQEFIWVNGWLFTIEDDN